MDGEHTARPPYFIHFGRGTVLGRISELLGKFRGHHT